MLEHVGGVRDIEPLIPKRKRVASAQHRARAWATTVQPHLAGVGVEGHVMGASCLERRGEVTGSASHVQDRRAMQGMPVIDLSSRVLGELRIEAIRVILLMEEGSEETDAPSYGGLEAVPRPSANVGLIGH